MAQSEVKQEAQFKVFGADSVKFTITEVDSENNNIKVEIQCDELTTQPDPLWLDVRNLETGIPVRMQIAGQVFSQVSYQKHLEKDVKQQLTDAVAILNQEQTVTAGELEKHNEDMHKQRANHFDPLVTQTQITTIFHEDDFDFQFENLMKELNS